jgi:DNA invertase Pin-like site-specific DNA recombinase
MHTDTAFQRQSSITWLTNINGIAYISDTVYKGNLMIKRVAIYLRVSTDSQTVENQHIELKAVANRLGWIVVETLADEGISGAKGRDQRPAFDRLMQMVARREIDLIACWSVDRLGRSLQHLVTFLGEINERQVDLYLHTQGLDTSTPAGRAMFSMLSVFAEFERSILRERIMAGLRRSTKKSGRPALDPDKADKIRRELSKGLSINATARKLKVGVGTVHRIKTKMAA